jgi:hypothetical protein
MNLFFLDTNQKTFLGHGKAPNIRIPEDGLKTSPEEFMDRN